MPGPLEGVRVLSFCRALAGPYTTMLLSDLGAEVTKIEDPNVGDFTRFAKPIYGKSFEEGVSSYFLSINRGKKSITLNLKDGRAKKIVFELAKNVDIIVENFRPGVIGRMGFDYETIRVHNPRIVYASVSGFGQRGPYAQKPAYDMLAQGMGGVVSITGEPGGAPVRVGFSIGDIGASLFAALSILAALYEREQSGEGQYIDVAMLDSQVALNENPCSRYFATGEIPKSLGSRHPLFTPFQVFPTKDGYIILIILKTEEWETFCRLAGREGWIEYERFMSNDRRLKNYPEFLEEMNDLMRMRTTSEWIDLLDTHGVMCGPVNNIEQVVNDSHVLDREMILEVDHSSKGKFKVVGTPMKFSRTPCRIEKACPELGEHTDEILSSLQGISAEEIQEFHKLKII
jgi:CoA:oxalate CoA-transferase